MEPSAHGRLCDAGWAYRMNDARGWIIYCDPKTGLWHTTDEAIRILDAQKQESRQQEAGGVGEGT